MVRSSALRLVAVLVFLAAVTPLYAATYSSTQTGNWSSASTWGGAGVPGAGDTATVNGGHVVTLTSSVTVATLTLAGGQITGTSSLNVTTLFNWNSGTLSGASTMTIASGTVGGGGTLDARALTNNGSFTISGGNYFYMQNGAQLTNNGTIDFLSDGGGIFQSGTLGTMKITNAGTIKKSGGTGSSTVGMPITGQSGSQVLAQTGTLNIAAVTATGTTFDASSGAIMTFNSADTRSLDATCTVSGAGTIYWAAGTNNIAANYAVTGVTKNSANTTIGTSITSTGDLVVNGNTLSLNNSTTLSIANLSMQSGTLAGNAPITLTGTTQTWTGGTIGGTGLLTIPSGTTVNFNGLVYFDTRSVSNAGSMIYTSNYYSYFYNSSTLTNSGTVNFQGDGGLYIGSGSPSITNSGTIEKTAGTGQGGIQVSLLSQSGSQISIQSGTILFGNVSATGTTFSVSSGAIAEFYYTASSSFDATSSISGAGTMLFAAGTNSVTASYNITGATNATGGTTTIGTNVTSVGSLAVNGGTLTVNNSSAPTTGTVTVGSGTLTLNYASTLTLATLLMQGGTLNGTASISLTGSSMTWTGGTIGGTGSLTIPVGTSIAFNGFVYFDTRTITNGGAWTYSSNYYSYLYNSASLTNNGTITFQGDGGFYIGGGSPSIINNGTITKSAGTGQGGIQVALTAASGSSVQIQSGTLLFGNVTATGASFSVSPGATMELYYTTTSSFDAASSIGGAGTVIFAAGTNTVNAAYNITGATNVNGGTTTLGSNVTSVGSMTASGGALTVNNSSAPTTGIVTVSGGTLTLNYTSTLTIATLTMQGGTLAGTAPISLTGSSMTWTGGTIGGTGSLTIPNGTSIAFNGYVYFDTRSITNGGTWTYSSNYYSYFYNSASLTNNGSVTFQGDGGFYIGSGSPSIINNGTITKSAGISNGGIQVALTAQSGSQLQVQSGTMLLGNVTATGASFTVSSGAALATYYTTTSTFDAASSISGAGTVGFGAGTNTINASYNVTGATKSSGGATTLTSITSLGDITMTGGTLTLNGASAISVPTITMQGGTLNGTLPIALTGSSMTWTGGVVGGTGTLTIPNTTTLTVSTGAPYFDGRPVSNAGIINITGTDVLYMENNAVLTNSGTIDLQGDSGIFLNSVAGTTAINNNGLIKKSSGTSSGSTINVQLNLNAGSQFQIQAGTCYLGNVTSAGATFGVASGALAYFYYTSASSFDAASTISGAGTIQWYAGTNTVNGTYNITGATKCGSNTTIGTSITSTGDLTVASGTLTLNKATAISVPTLTMQGGTLAGTAPINITGTTQSWTGGTIAGTGVLSIPNTMTTTVSGSPVLDTRTIANAGTINLLGGNYLYMQNNAVLNNSGIIDVQADGNLYQSGTIGTTAITNSGTIKKSGGTSGSTFSVPITLQSGGQLLIQASIAYLGNINSTGGTLNMASGTTAYLYYTTTATFDSASTISGLGTLQNGAGTNSIAGTISTPILMTGGTLAINSASAQSVPTLTMQGGTLNGSGNLGVTGAAMTWTGGLLGGTGTLSIPVGTTVTISGIVYIDTRTVSNAGLMTFTGTNYIYMQNNGVLNNSGTIDFPGDNAIYLSGGAGTTMINDSGTIKKSAGTGSYVTAPLTLQSGGQFLVQSGIVYFGDVTGSGGTLNMSSGATAYLYYTTAAAFSAATTISGSGTLQNGAGTNSIAGTITSPLTMTGGTLSINSATTQSIPVLTMNGGTLNGTANLAVTSPAMTWTGGVIGGSGTFSIPSGTTITISGVPFFDTRAVTNAGTLSFTSSNYLYMENAATLNNTGTINFQGDNGIYFYTGSAPSLTNNGLLTKSGGTGTATINITATNAASGVIEPVSGTISFSSLTENGTLYFPIAGATSFGKVNVTSPFVLGGTLHATTTSGYTPVNGTTFQVLTYPSSSGAFAAKNLLYSGGGQFTDSYTSNAMTLTAGNGTCYTLPAGAISWYRAEGNAVDSVGTNNAAVTNATFGTGYNGQGFILDGSTAYVSAPDSASLHPASLTAEGWVKFSSLPGTLAVVVAKTYTTGTYDSLAIWYDPAGMLHSEVSDASGEMLLGSAWSPVVGTWYHLALTFDSSTQVETLYLNGSQVATASFPGRSIAYDTHPLVIGADINSETYGYYFPGAIDEVTLYNQALSATQIQDIYFTGTAGKCYTASTPTITGFSPSSGATGTSVTITGTNFIGASAVAFNGTPAASFTINSSSQITAVVAAGTTNGPITVTTAGGVATSASSFTFSCTPPVATVTAPSAVCGNAINVGASVTTTAGATYNWSITNGVITSGQGTSAITFNPGASGVVNLNVTVTDASSCSASGNANVTINPAPSATITAPPSICSTTTGNASVAATGGATYNWSITNGTITGGSGTNAITFSPAASGTVTLAITVVSTNGCSSSGNANIPINGAPTATITAPASACASASANASVPFQSGATYTWSVTNGSITSGAGTSAIVFTAGASGNVSINVTVANGGCSATSNVTLPINAAPTPVITGPNTTCAGSPVTLDAGAGFTSYLWSTGATTQTVTVSPSSTTNYSVTVTNGSGCSGTSSYSVTANPLPPSSIAAPPSICATATGNASVSATAGATYNWSILNGTINSGAGTNAITFTPGSTGNVTVAITVTSTAGCSSNSTVSIPINGTPSATIAAPPAVCASTNANASVASQAGATYNWSITNGTINSGAGTNVISFTAGASGNVTLNLTVSNGGCSSSSSATIPINAVPAPVITGPSTTCAGSPITLDAGAGYSSYLWSNGAVTQTITVSPSVNTTYSVTVANGGCSATTSHPVTVSPAPAATINKPSSVTPSSTGNGASVPATPGATYNWTISNGSITAGQGTTAIVFTAGPSGSIILGVTVTGTSCSASGTATVPIAAATGDVSVSLSASPTTVDAGNAVAFTITVHNGGPGTAMNVSVANTISSPTATFVGTSSVLSCSSPSGPTVTCTAPTLSPGASATITITWNATTTDPALAMSSSVSSSNDSNGGNNNASAAATVNQPLPPPQPNGNPCANPTATSLTSPANGATLNSSTVHFTWTAVSGASSYRLWVAVNGAAFATAGDAANTSMDVTISSGSVEWYVETLYTGCSSVESAHRTFSIPPKQNCGINGNATNLSPTTDVSTPSVTFSWSAVAGATGYEVWLSLNGGTATLLGTTNATSLTHDVPPGALEWFVRANFDGCPQTESAHVSFSYNLPVQCSDSHPLAVSPLNNSLGLISPIDFSWKEATGATSYKVWISVNDGAYSLLGTAPDAHLDNATVPAGSINWYIEALSNGCASTKSTVSHFTVVKAPTGCPDLTAPLMIVPASASSGVQYTISWQPVGGATSYDVQSANNVQFIGAAQSSSTSTQFNFTTTNNTAQPLVKYFRVRANATCQPAPGPFSDASAVVILPSTTAGKQLQGSAPADQAQTITYTIPLDASLAGLSFTATPNQPWITVTPSSGIIPAGGLSLHVQADTDGLPVGTSLGGITITTSGGGASSTAHTSATSSSTVTTLSVSLVSPSLPTSKSTPPPDALIIPAVAHANGINSTFQSDVRVTNTSAQVVKYQVTFTPTGDAGIADGKQTTIDIDPGKTIALDDVLGTWFTSLTGSSIGVLEIRPLTSQSSTVLNPSSQLASASALSTFASSRTFNVTANGTYGQYIPAIPFASFIGGSKDAASASILSLQQISQSDAFRTNLGFVEGSGQPASLLVSVFDHSGVKVTDFPLQLAAGQHTQFSLGTQGVSQLADGRVEVKVLSPTGKVTTYASVLDNQTNDPLLVSPVNLSAAGNTNFVVPGVADLSNGVANWRTDMRVFNASSKSVDATLSFYSQNGGEPKSVTMTLGPNEVKDLDGTLANTFGITNDGGAVHITTLTPSSLVATARTYNQTANGTYGQFIPAVTPGDAAGTGSRPLQILQLEESDRYRSNVGVVEVSGKPAKVQISVIPPDGRVTGIAELDLAPNEFRQLNSMLKSFGLGTAYNARVTVKVISGDGRVAAYASVIDQVTQDPTYVPAQ